MALQVSHLTGFGSGGGGGPFTLTFQAVITATVASPTATYTNAPIGTASSDRIVFAGFTTDASTSSNTFTCTIGGISATQIVYGENTVSPSYAVLFGAVVPTGTTATIVVTSSATMTALTAIAVWTATGLQSLSPTSTATDEGSNPSPSTVNVSITSANNATIGIIANTGAILSDTWSGLTENYDGLVSTSWHGGASASSSPVGTLAVTHTPSGGNEVMAVASFSQ